MAQRAFFIGVFLLACGNNGSASNQADDTGGAAGESAGWSALGRNERELERRKRRELERSRLGELGLGQQRSGSRR
jgi:hypothetical protein